MTEKFKIYIDRLKNGYTEKIQEEVNSSFLDIAEEELSFPAPVVVQGEAYLAQDHLILHMKAKTKAQIPCTVCNEPFPYPIETDFYNTIPIEEITNSVFDYSNILRESILIEIPSFTECHGGTCPEREIIRKYLKKISTDTPDIQFPFSGLGL